MSDHWKKPERITGWRAEAFAGMCWGSGRRYYRSYRGLPTFIVDGKLYAFTARSCYALGDYVEFNWVHRRYGWPCEEEVCHA